MKNYELLRQLIDIAEQLENEYHGRKAITLDDFANYLKANTDARNKEKPALPLNAKPLHRRSEVIELDTKNSIENNISRLLLLLVRHARNYAKKAFENTPLLSLEDFSYLATLYNLPSSTKSQLIAYNFQEKTSGTEVIRRLLSNGLAAQFDDKLDKRSQRVSITPKGKKVLESVFQNMGVVSNLLVASISAEERSYLLTILQKLDSFHRSAFQVTRNMTMEELKEVKPIA
jgi:DNA-binding MarR family transcriptional regulator